MQFTVHDGTVDQAPSESSEVKKTKSTTYKSAYAQDKTFMKKIDQQKKALQKGKSGESPTRSPVKVSRPATAKLSPVKKTKTHQGNTSAALHAGVSPSKMRATAGTQKPSTATSPKRASTKKAASIIQTYEKKRPSAAVPASRTIMTMDAAPDEYTLGARVEVREV